MLVRPHGGGEHQDKTGQTRSYRRNGPGYTLEFERGGRSREYPYTTPGRVVVLEDPEAISLEEGTSVEIGGSTWSTVTELLRFDGPEGSWTRVFYPTRSGEHFRTYPSSQVRVRVNAAARPRSAEILAYWQDLVDGLPPLGDGPDPLVRVFGHLRDIDPASVLARFLEGEPIEEDVLERSPLFPLASNLSQRDALGTALSYPISVIDGPPGTGKTQTILNLLATLVAAPGLRVGMVSANNAAVENVHRKMSDAGYEFLLAPLGRQGRRKEFFSADRQRRRNAQLDSFMQRQDDGASALSRSEAAERLRGLEERLRARQEQEVELARSREELAAHRLEQSHFLRYLQGHDVADLDGTVLLRRSSERIMDFLVESQQHDRTRSRPLRWITRLRWLFVYGPLRGHDPAEADVALAVQKGYYERRIAELEAREARLDTALRATSGEDLAGQERELSTQLLRAGLRDRYASIARTIYREESLREPSSGFLQDYPVVLSTCHSLRASTGGDALLDVLIVDESSQVDLLAAAPALAMARRIVVVGDLAQLPHIPSDEAVAAARPAPHPAYDYKAHSLLSSLQAVYGDSLPRTMLREHYRCEPSIIGFCNEKFYRGQLIPCTSPAPPEESPLVLHTTVEGNHMRGHRGSGRSNQREIDVIETEVIPQTCKGIPRERIGIVAPYRAQVTKVGAILVEDLEATEADTVHRFQGREKQAVIMSTVLDETSFGRRGLSFVDDPHLINVAVSRAERKFVLVTDSDMLPTSRHLRDLMDYMLYQDPASAPRRSEVVSVFDLLYQHYSRRLDAFASRLRGEMEFRSEDIVWTLLREMLDEAQHDELDAVPQVIVENLLPSLAGLTVEQAVYVENRCSLDFVVYRRVSRTPILAIEVNGTAFHEDRPDRLAKDELKRQIMDHARIPLLTLRTTDSDVEGRLRRALGEARSR